MLWLFLGFHLTTICCASLISYCKSLENFAVFEWDSPMTSSISDTLYCLRVFCGNASPFSSSCGLCTTLPKCVSHF